MTGLSEQKQKLKKIISRIGENLVEICEVILEAAEEAPEEVKKRKRDPNAPKQPPTSYFIFASEIRDDIEKQYPDLSFGEKSKIYSARWKELSDEEKQVYSDKSKVFREKYLKEVAAYEEEQGLPLTTKKTKREESPVKQEIKKEVVLEDGDSSDSDSDSSSSDSDSSSSDSDSD